MNSEEKETMIAANREIGLAKRKYQDPRDPNPTSHWSEKLSGRTIPPPPPGTPAEWDPTLVTNLV